MDLPATVAEVNTPCFLVDVGKVEKNCQKLTAIAKNGNVALRPHMKTAKTVESGTLQTAGTKRKISVSTVAEATFYADAGFDDILLSSIVSTNKLQKCKELSERLEDFLVMIDSEYSFNLLQTCPLEGGKKWKTFLKVDVGYLRAGLMYDDPKVLSLAQQIHSSECVTLRGLYCHEGSSYNAPNTGEEHFELARTRMVQTANTLREAGVDCPHVTVGSTPSCSHEGGNTEGLTEIHPGNYVFYDMENATLGSCTQDEIACKVATRIIGIYPDKGHMLTDSGFTAHSHDGTTEGGFKMAVVGHPELRMAGMCQEVGKIKAAVGTDMDWDRYSVGDMLFIYPWHSCATANMYMSYLCHHGDAITGEWVPVKGW